MPPNHKSLEEVIFEDIDDNFIRILRKQLEKDMSTGEPADNFNLFPAQLFELICLNDAVKCATALLDLETGWFVDINAPLPGGLTPLQIAAHRLSLPLIELFLLRGADPNLPLHVDTDKLPLYLALDALSCQYLSDWNPGKSVFKLFYILCLHELKKPLTIVKLLALRTKQLEVISIRCVEERKINQLGVLLLIAWHALVTPYAIKGIEACPISQCISNKLKLVSAADQELKPILFQTPGSPVSPYQSRTELESAWKMLTVLEKTRAYIQEYRTYPPDTEAHFVPFEAAKYLCMLANVSVAPDDVYSDDVKCLMPRIAAAHKAWLDEEIQKQLNSAMSAMPAVSKACDMGSMLYSRSFHTSRALDANFMKDVESEFAAVSTSWPVLAEKVQENRSFEVMKERLPIQCIVNEDGSMDLEPRMKGLLQHDDEDAFVTLVNSVPCHDAAVPYIISYIFEYDAVSCAERILDHDITDVNEKFHLRRYFSNVGSTPLHKAASVGAIKLTALLLAHGEDANARRVSLCEGKNGTLPLDDALARIRLDTWWQYWSNAKSVLYLLAILCWVYKDKELEIVRMLAEHTNDLDLVLIDYVKKGKLIELGALMLLGYRCSCATFSVNELWSEVKEPERRALVQLFEVFSSIGDKLEAYAKLKRSDLVTGLKVVTEISSLFEDAGLTGTSQDILIQDIGFSFERLDVDERKTPMFWSAHRGFNVEQALFGSSQRFHRFEASRSYHSCSKQTVHEDNSNRRKISVVLSPSVYHWRKCFWVMANLRRGVRYL